MMLVDRLKERVERYWSHLKAHDPYNMAIFDGTATPDMVSRFLVNIQHLVQHTPAHLQMAIQASGNIKAEKILRFFQ